MKYLFILPVILILLSCNNSDKKRVDKEQASIYKIWQFKKTNTTAKSNHNNAAWIGDNLLDLTNKDTLRFSYGNTNNKPTAYPYKIVHDTIFINNKPGYQILRLTATELYLMAAFTNSGIKNAGNDSVVMAYHSK